MDNPNSKTFTAFFDSGLGGLNTLVEAIKLMPGASFIYYGDTANVPYGPKSNREIHGFMVESLGFLAPFGLKALVLACNTATCAVAGQLRAEYELPIIGMEPAIKPAMEIIGASGKRVLLLATVLTIESAKVAALKAKIDPNGLIDDLPCPELVELAENLDFDQNNAAGVLKKKLADFDLEQYGAVVLGSTHFCYFREAVEMIFPKGVMIIDGNAGTVRHLMEVIAYEPPDGPGTQSEILLHMSNGHEVKKVEMAKAMLEKASGRKVRLI